MRAVSARFVKSAMLPQDFPREGYPEIAFAGRSNVGKSSLLNSLLGRKGLAKTSKTPGKTRTVNFFAVNERFYFVDLPGYGYARVARSLKETWGRMITSYVAEREALRLVVQLIDARHPPTPNDHELLALLDEARVPTLLVATKFDKLKQSERHHTLKVIQKELELDEEAALIPCSSVTGEGIKELWSFIEDQL